VQLECTVWVDTRAVVLPVILACRPALQDKQTVDPNRVGGPTNALLGENSLTTTIGAAGGLANDAASNALRRMAARLAA
jgi:hypothetical protein